MRPWLLARGVVRAAFGLPAALAATAAGPAYAQFDALGSGAGWFDCNEDGWLDACILTPQGYLTLLVYEPTLGLFVEDSDAFPPTIQGVSPGTGVACGDLNGDGLSDLFLTFGPDRLRRGGGNQLFLNRGGETFQQVSRTAGIVPGPQGEALSATAALFDYNRDGLLDIYVVNYGDPFYDTGKSGWSNQLFRNDGVDAEGIPHFTDVGPALGVDRGRQGQSNWSLGAVTFDYDNDGDTDLYVVNDYDGIDNDGFLRDGDNTLYRNEGNGTFADVSYASGSADAGWGMGGAAGDYNGDGWLDLFVTNFWEDALLRNNGNGTFTNVTAAAGLPTTRAPFSDPPCVVCNSWGTAFIDYDNDGDLDLHVVNGFITNSEGQSLEEPDQLFENLGPAQPGKFQEVGIAAGVAMIGDGRGSAYGDLNRDGFVDILVMNNQLFQGSVPIPPRALFVNQGDGTFREQGVVYSLRASPPDGSALPARKNLAGNRWIQIRAVGVQSNRSGIGARITVEAGGRTWIQDVGTSSYCSSNSPYLHFGLGPVASIDRVKVRFPSGVEVVRNAPPLNDFLTVHENDPTPVRLLSYAATFRPEGVHLGWALADAHEASFVILEREVQGVAAWLATVNVAADGTGEYLDREAPRETVLHYHLDALLRDGVRERLGTATVSPAAAPRLALGQNRPNPFTLTTSIPVAGNPGEGRTIQILDASGRLVRELPGAQVQDGALVWDGRDARGRRVSPGAYFYRLSGQSEALRMIRRP